MGVVVVLNFGQNEVNRSKVKFMAVLNMVKQHTHRRLIVDLYSLYFCSLRDNKEIAEFQEHTKFE